MTLSAYLHLAMSKARYKLLEDGSCFGEIPGFKGVWAEGRNLKKCRHELQEVLDEWIVLKLRDQESLPTIGGKGLKLPAASRA